METKKNVLHVHEFPRLSTKEDLVVEGYPERATSKEFQVGIG